MLRHYLELLFQSSDSCSFFEVEKYNDCHKTVTLLTEAGAAIHMQARARVAFAVVGAPGVNTSVLAASIMDLAFINICREGGREKRERKKQAEGERQERN